MSLLLRVTPRSNYKFRFAVFSNGDILFIIVRIFGRNDGNLAKTDHAKISRYYNIYILCNTMLFSIRIIIIGYIRFVANWVCIKIPN